ncbi:MAG: hypothetical protein IKW14_05950 [Phascolarctobacterium sp.]|nr:hypothetical protein [Phascolarctobacterium sp.]
MENKINDILKLIGLEVGERFQVFSFRFGKWKLDQQSLCYIDEKGNVMYSRGACCYDFSLKDLFNGNLKVRSTRTQLPKVPFPIIPAINKLENDIDVSGNKKVRFEECDD